MTARSFLPGLAVFCICGAFLAAQPVIFFQESFDNNNAGWTLDTEWGIGPATASTGQTPSCGNGDPGMDATGTPGGGVAGVVIGGNASPTVHAPYWLTSPALDTTSLAGVQLDFDRWLNSDYAPYMINYVEVFDGVAWVTIWQTGGFPGVQDAAWTHQTFNVSAYSNTNFQVRFGFEIGSTGVYTCSSWNLDNVVISDPGPPDYQLNTSAASMDIDGVTASEFSPAVVNLSVINCQGTPSPATATLTYSSAVAGTLYDIAVSPANLVPLSGAGVMLPGGILNLSLAGGFTFVNGGATLNLQPMPGSGFPGATPPIVVQVPLAFTAAFDGSFQAVYTDPSSPAGYRLSQGVELHVAVTSGAPSIPGPTGDDSNVSVDVTAAPTCWVSTGGIPFYGTVFTTMDVSSNGRVLFGGADTDFSPSITDALADNPFVGAWTDLNPSSAGTITISNPSPNVVRVDWVGVDYYGAPGTGNTFGIEFDAGSNLVSMDGLMGIVAQPGTGGGGDDMFLGMSPGNLLTATDPGAVTFTAGGAGGVTTGTDMLYDWYDSTLGGGLAPSLLPGSLNQIFFVPSTAFPNNYDWAGI